MGMGLTCKGIENITMTNKIARILFMMFSNPYPVLGQYPYPVLIITTKGQKKKKKENNWCMGFGPIQIFWDSYKSFSPN